MKLEIVVRWVCALVWGRKACLQDIFAVLWKVGGGDVFTEGESCLVNLSGSLKL